MAAVQKFRDDKYSTWEWNYGHTPEYNMKTEKKFPAGLVTAFVQTKNNTIEDIHCTGDFFGKGNLRELEENMIGLHLDHNLSTQLKAFDINYYMNGIDAQQLTELLL